MNNLKQVAKIAIKSMKNSASSLAKTNLASGLVSFACGTVSDIIKGKDITESIQSNALSSAGSAIGGFLGGLVGSAVPLIGTSIGGAVGSVLGSVFVSYISFLF